MVISLASFALAVPSPIDSPTCAFLSARASLVPSPVTATTCPCCWSSDTSRDLSVGRARESTFSVGSTCCMSCSSVISAKAAPVMVCKGSSALMIPVSRAISLAVSATSPVTMITRTPAPWHVSTASRTSSLTGSAMPMNPVKISGVWQSPSICCAANASVLRPMVCSFSSLARTSSSVCPPAIPSHMASTTSGAPLTNFHIFPELFSLATVTMCLVSDVKATCSVMVKASRSGT